MWTALVAGSVLAVSSTASAQTFFAVNNLGGVNRFTSGGDQLITFDFSTAEWTPVGGGDGEIRDQNGEPIRGLGGLDFDGSGTLYLCGSYGNFPRAMYTIDPDTANATYVGRTQAAMLDIAWDPNTQDLYGIDAFDNLWANVDDPANAVHVGNFRQGNLTHVGLAFDSAGNIYVHDIDTDFIFTGNAGSLTELRTRHRIPFDSRFSQGLFVDWSRDDVGYHAAITSASTAPNFLFGTQVSGGGYGPQVSSFDIHTNGLTEVQAGDLTRMPQRNCRSDLDGDGDADADDFFGYLDAFAVNDIDVCDIDGDGNCDADDFFDYLDLFAAGCP